MKNYVYTTFARHLEHNVEIGADYRPTVWKSPAVMKHRRWPTVHEALCMYIN